MWGVHRDIFACLLILIPHHIVIKLFSLSNIIKLSNVQVGTNGDVCPWWDEVILEEELGVKETKLTMVDLQVVHSSLPMSCD